jgi:uncharacterized protein YcbK (DUF882 family)
MKLSEHFSSVEAACRCGRDECEYSEHLIISEPELLATTKKTAAFLETVRTFLGGQPLHVNSWWRCLKHNTEVGGEPNSYHMKCFACDITHRSLSPAEVQRKLSTKAGRALIDGFGRYKSFTHCDRRGYKADWNNR